MTQDLIEILRATTDPTQPIIRDHLGSVRAISSELCRARRVINRLVLYRILCVILSVRSRYSAPGFDRLPGTIGFPS